jgi:hypothetical protein
MSRKFINCVMKHGKKATAQTIFNDAMVELKTQELARVRCFGVFPHHLPLLAHVHPHFLSGSTANTRLTCLPFPLRFYLHLFVLPGA